MKPTLLLLPLLTASAAWFAGPVAAQSQSIPVQSADDSYVAQPRPPIEPDMRGYGTRGVEGRTLREMLDRCAAAASRSAGAVEQARCEQLRRTVKNQPGNATGS